jgi:UDP-N-acetylmuramoyl-tripeptide--D-alanyl-D-alanine ligase
MRFTVEQIQQATGGTVLQPGPEAFERFGIDSRTVPEGSLFFAMRGENTDGHLFVSDAFRNGAAGAVVEREIEPPASNFLLLRVPDSMKALQRLSVAARESRPRKFVGLTGSCGKTSTKEFTAALLSQRYKIFKSEGNLNSLTGLPLSLLSMGDEACGVFELGMNNPGEIAQLGEILRPDIAMVLNVNPVHLGQFSSLDAIANEKFSLLSHMPADATGIYNADDPLLRTRSSSLKQRSFSFGFSTHASLRILDFQELGVHGSQGCFQWKEVFIPFHTKLCGVANAQNIAAASLCALLLNVEPEQIGEAIQTLQPYKQRGRLVYHRGIAIYDDTYNSNPRALDLTLQVIERSHGFARKAAILGDMFELGPEETKFHTMAGEQVAAHHIDLLIAAGSRSKSMADAARRSGVKEVYWTENATAAGEKANQVLKEGDLVLIKGSRGMKMENTLDVLTKE